MKTLEYGVSGAMERIGAPTVVVSAVGGILALHGADQISKGLKQFITNKPQESLTVIALKESGVPPNVAHILDDWIGIVGATTGLKILVKEGSIAKEAIEKAVKEIGNEGKEFPKVIRKEFYPKENGRFFKGDHTPLAPGGGLEFHEALEGHTLKHHVEKSVDYLNGRFVEKPTLQHSSTFYNREIAVALESVGIRISRDSDLVENINTFRIVLEKDIKSPLGYRIKTAYPKKI